jgi:mannose-6-phosphate isomerase
LESLYHKELPPEVPIGESWEVTDREEGVSEIANGPLAGKTLRWLMENYGPQVMGVAYKPGARFPLLIKILDSRQNLSLQVHPPASVAASLGGEPKTEMWYITQADKGAKLYAGLKKNATREEFERRLTDGTVADLFHCLEVQAGDSMFLPSGRVHAIGEGLVIFEIQQNSDTTYRVFDWNRVGLDGKPRQLHVKQAMQCIDFNDLEPQLIKSQYSRNPVIKSRFLVDDALFTVDTFQVRKNQRFYIQLPVPVIIGVIEGQMTISGGGQSVIVKPGQFCLMPSGVERVTIETQSRVHYIQAQPKLEGASNVAPADQTGRA